MKKTLTLLVAIGSIACANAQKSLTPGNLVIYRVGDGSAPLTGKATAVFLDEHTTDSVVHYKTVAPLINTIALPSTVGSAAAGNYILSANGTGTTEGQITLSKDNRYLVFAGYNSGADTATLGVATSATSTVLRVVGTVDQSGKVNTTTALNWATKLAPRAVASMDGKKFFLSQSGAGIFTANLGDTGKPTQISAYNKTSRPTQSPTPRSLAIYDDSIYVAYQSTFLPGGAGTSTQSISFGTLGSVSNPDTTTHPLAGIDTVYKSALPTVTKASPYQFAIIHVRKGTVMYIADDGTNGALTERGIQKYSLVGGTWTYNGSIYAKGVRGLAVYNSGDTVIVYGTAPTKLYGAFDLTGFNNPPFGPMPGDSAIVLDTAIANTAFRGIAFVPGTPVLPVALKNGLNGSLVNGSAKLTWATATEVSTKSFVIEKSIDGKTFSTLATISAKNKPSAYEFTEASKLTGSAYYRLKITNNDGSFSYSESVQLNNKVSAKLSIYPNPVVNNATVSHTQAAAGAILKVSTIGGKTISTYQVSTGATQTSINVSNLTKGSYVISYENNGSVSTTKFVK